ncbi:MAG: flagellar assembly protein FliW [Clostridiaceae bacterium]|jgi:flagellar assembly factor FliW|nr:flagellar assembly protein FliW [Clostridiaceae bacterium]
MQIQTRLFGTIEIDDNETLYFPSGIPGFENVKKFVLLGRQEAGVPFFWLQGIDDPDLAFVVTDPFYIHPDYFVDVDDEEITELDIKDTEHVLTISIVTIPDKIENMSVNLRAPILINTRNNTGKQIVMKNDTFPIKYYIMNKK